MKLQRTLDTVPGVFFCVNKAVNPKCDFSGSILEFFFFLRVVLHPMWIFSVSLVAIIILFVMLAAVLAVHAPTKRIHNMKITETINDL